MVNVRAIFIELIDFQLINKIFGIGSFEGLSNTLNIKYYIREW